MKSANFIPTVKKHADSIPLDAGKVDGWKTIAIQEASEPLVPIGAYSTEATAILTSSVYYGEHDNSPYIDTNRLEGSLLSVFVRKKVAKRLLEAQQLLPQGYRLIVFDGYRPLQVQDSLFRFYRDQLQRQRPNMNQDELDVETQKYVSIPSTDPTRPSPHNTGGSVDLAIIKLPLEQSAILDDIDHRLADEHLDIEDRIILEIQKSAIVRRHAEMLDFGTAFDHGGERAAIAYFEKQLISGTALSPAEIKARDNRHLLYKVMTRVGMQAYEAEWWHFNAPESQMGAAAAGSVEATYGAATFSMRNIAHEKLRQSAGDPRMVTRRWPTEVIGPQMITTRSGRK